MIFKRIIDRSLHFALAVICLFLVVSPLWAEGDIESKPDIDDKIYCYYIWRDKDGIHLRTISAGVLHSFSGRITMTNGVFEDLDKASNKMKDEDVRLSNPHTIVFSYETEKDEFGFDFNVDGYYPCIKFDLKIDKKREIRRTFLGEHKLNPWGLPFTHCR